MENVLHQRRSRRRGPRSSAARLRRCVRRHLRHLPEEHVEISPASPDVSVASGGLVPDSFTFLHANVQGFMSKTAEISRLIERSNYPTFIGFTETFLEKAGKTTPAATVAGYVQVARLDRRTGERQGGIILFARKGFENNIVHVGDSKEFERSWFIVHSDRGPLLLGLWYRRPARGEIDSVTALADELNEYGNLAIHTIVMGDFNVHEVAWLRYSDGTTPEGRELHDIANAHGLEEKVRKPTRGDYLLDLVLSDLGSQLKCGVVPGVSDHDAVVGTVSFGVPETHEVTRELFDYKSAAWPVIEREFASLDWRALLHGVSADRAAEVFTEVVSQVVRRNVRCNISRMRVSSHPWLNDRCRHAIDAKINARGTADEADAREQCSATLLDEFNAYVAKTRGDLRDLPRSSKKWWRLSNSLQGRTKGSSVQSLHRQDGSWARTSVERAELLSDVFAQKSQLPDEILNEYTDMVPDAHAPPDSFLRVRQRSVLRILRKLKVDSATGPDGIASRVLKNCASSLAYPISVLVRAMLAEGRWPQCWRLHRIVPLHKRKAKSDPNNYRGVHLTCQVSKVVERVCGQLFKPALESSGAFGHRQFAYARGRGYRDALALMALSWIQGLEKGNLIAVYCSDVSGAFDRVCEQRIGRKLQGLGLHPRVCQLLLSWLEPRLSEVVVEGATATRKHLKNSVYQGTVLGSPLWNIHYADAAKAVRKQGFLEVIFADDLNCVREFGPEVSQRVVEHELRQCQRELHAWGGANRVLFDPGKESFHGIHRGRHFGDEFKILGVIFDTQLGMHAAAREIAREAGWRLKTLLRCRRYYTTPDLVKLYKAQILSYIESGTPALHHAAPSVLECVDRVQRRFLREVGLSEERALTEYRLAPLCARRDIAMIGMLHRITSGTAPSELAKLFVPVNRRTGFGTRNLEVRHERQLREFVSGGCHTETCRRSAFGLVTVWNMLPGDVVMSKSTKVVQRRLQDALRNHMESGQRNWQTLCANSARRMTPVRFQSLFV